MKRFHIIMLILLLASAAALGGTLAYKHYTQDQTLPEITFEQDPLSVSVADGRAALMLGVSAYDAKDGDITSKLILEKVEMDEHGQVNATYAVCDNDNHVASRTRTIIYTDYEKPRFSISDALSFAPSSSVQLRDRVKANDVIDGDISDNIRINTNSLSPYYAGLYAVTFEVTNSLGDRAALTLDVEIREMNYNEPEIELSTYLVYITEEQAKTFDAASYVKSVSGAQKSDVHASNTRLQPGVNRISYSCRNENGVRGSSALYVVVGSAEGGAQNG